MKNLWRGVVTIKDLEVNFRDPYFKYYTPTVAVQIKGSIDQLSISPNLARMTDMVLLDLLVVFVVLVIFVLFFFALLNGHSRHHCAKFINRRNLHPWWTALGKDNVRHDGKLGANNLPKSIVLVL